MNLCCVDVHGRLRVVASPWSEVVWAVVAVSLVAHGQVGLSGRVPPMAWDVRRDVLLMPWGALLTVLEQMVGYTDPGRPYLLA